MRFCLVQDQDAHWYLVPAERKESFGQICDQAYSSDDFSVFEKEFGEMRIDSPNQLTFADPKDLDGDPLK